MIRNIKSNIKGFDQVFPSGVGLGMHNLVIGPNESGKSALADSLRALVYGNVTGILFRKGPIKLPTYIRTLAEGPIEVVGNEGEYSFTLAEGKAKHTGPKSSGLDMESVREAFSGSPEKALAFIATQYSGQGSVAVNTTQVFAAAEGTPHEKIIDQFLFAEKTPKISCADLLRVCDAIEERGNDVAEVGKVAKKISENQGILLGGVPVTLGSMLQRTQISGALALLAMASADTVIQIKKLIAQTFPVEVVKQVINEGYSLPDLKRAAVSEHFADLEKQALALDAERVRYKEAAEWLRAKTYGNIRTRLIPILEAGASRYMPEGERLSLHKTLLIPLVTRGGVTFQAASASTEARLLAVLSCSFPSLPGLLVIDDRMWDRLTLLRLMKALDTLPVQVVIMTTVAPSGRWRGSWNVIELPDRRGIAEDAG